MQQITNSTNQSPKATLSYTISNEICLARLYKAPRGVENDNPADNNPGRTGFTFLALGYYDSVTFEIDNSSRDLAIRCQETPNVNEERVALVPVSSYELDFDNLQAIGLLSFIITDDAMLEKPATEIFEMAECLEDILHGNKDRIKEELLLQTVEENEINEPLVSKCFVTTGASSIAVLSVFPDVGKAISGMKNYLKLLQAICLRKESFVYTFSIPLLRTNISQVRSALESTKETFDAIVFSLGRKLSGGDSFEETVATVKTTLLGGNHNTIVSEKIITGSDDYTISATNVRLLTLIDLIKPGGALHESVKNGVYDSISTTLGFDSWTLGNIQTDTNAQKKVASECPTILANLKTNQFTDELQPDIAAFLALYNSNYTRWAYQNYESVISLGGKLLLQLMDWRLYNDLNMKVAVEGAHLFFNSINEMLESLLNTSGDYTDSPGYRKIEKNMIPRLILGYQNMMNVYAAKWDKENGTPDREHIFLLTPHIGKEINALMFFGSLPPDKRVIKVSLPIRYAFRPITGLSFEWHEMGHYIGVRDRSAGGNTSGSKARVHYMAEIISVLFCRKMIEYYVAEIADITDISKLLKGKEGTLAQQEFACTMAYALYEVRGKIVYEIIDTYPYIKKLRVDELKQKINSLGVDQCNIRHVMDRKVKTIERDYFSEMTPIIKEILTALLDKLQSNILNSFNALCEKVIAKNPSQRSSCLARELEFESLCPHLIEQAKRDLIRNDVNRNIVTEAKMILSEVAADVFMVQSLSMSINDYLLLFLEQYYLAHDIKELEDFIQSFESVQVDNMRVLAVVQAMKEMIDEKNSQEVYDWMSYNPDDYEKKRIDDIKKLSQNNQYDVGELYEKLKSVIQEAADHYSNRKNVERFGLPKWTEEVAKSFNPYYMVEDYTRQLFRDHRYAQNEIMRPMRAIFQLAKKEIVGEASIGDVYRMIYQFSWDQQGQREAGRNVFKG